MRFSAWSLVASVLLCHWWLAVSFGSKVILDSWRWGSRISTSQTKWYDALWICRIIWKHLNDTDEWEQESRHCKLFHYTPEESRSSLVSWNMGDAESLQAFSCKRQELRRELQPHMTRLQAAAEAGDLECFCFQTGTLQPWSCFSHGHFGQALMSSEDSAAVPCLWISTF